MELCMLCQESQLMSFVENMEDLEMLFASMTPVVEKFFENSFTTTMFTKRIKNLNWKLGDQLEVIGKQTSTITQAYADNKINDG